MVQFYNRVSRYISHVTHYFGRNREYFRKYIFFFQKLGKKLSMDKAGVQKTIPASTKRNILGIQVETVRNQPNTYILSDFQRWKIYPKLLKDMLTFYEKMSLALSSPNLIHVDNWRKSPALPKHRIN